MSSEWTLVPLENLTDGTSITYGVVKPGDECVDGVPFIRGGDIVSGRVLMNQLRTISPEISTQYSRTLLRGGELLISLVGNPGEVAIAPGTLRDANIARQVGLIRIDGSKANANYVQYFLRSKVGRDLLIAHSKGSVQQVINLKDLKSVKIPLPPLRTQGEIALVMQSIDDRITLLRETNATLEAIAQALFKSWFVDFDPVRAKMEGCAPEDMDEATAQMFPDSFEESELGLMPRGWGVARIDEFMELAYGRALKATDRIAGEVPVYGSGGVTGFHNESLVTGPSIIIGRKGTVGSLYWEDQPFFAIDTVFYVRTANPMTYCFYLLQTLGLIEMNTDAAVPGLNRGNVYRLTVPFPGAEILGAFDDIVGVIRRRICNNNQQAQSLATLRDTLLPRLISGQLRLPQTESMLENA